MTKLNLGSGDKYLEGYINLDFSVLTNNSQKTKCDVFHNMKLGLPFETDYADEILFHQTLEHFNYHDGIEILKEIRRVLKPSGDLFLSVPPALQQMKIFITKASSVHSIDDFYKAHQNFTPIKYHDDVAGGTIRTIIDGVDIGDFLSHKTFFSKNMLKVLLEYVGFKILKIDEQIQCHVTK